AGRPIAMPREGTLSVTSSTPPRMPQSSLPRGDSRSFSHTSAKRPQPGGALPLAGAPNRPNHNTDSPTAKRIKAAANAQSNDETSVSFFSSTYRALSVSDTF